MCDLLGSPQSIKIRNQQFKIQTAYKLSYQETTENCKPYFLFLITFVGSKLTRPQARAATPLQLCEIANIPTESGPG